MRLRCFYCGKSVSTEVSDDTVVRASLECPECIEKKNSDQCVKDSTPKGLTQQEMIQEMWKVDCQKILGTPENVHQVKLSAYAKAIHTAQERKGKDTNVA